MFKYINIKTISKYGINNTIETFIDDTKIHIIIDDCVEIMFVCLANNLDHLIYGYLKDINRADIEIAIIANNKIAVKTKLSKDEVLDLIKQKDLVGTCESIEIADSKLESSKIVIPFNNTRYKIKNDVLLDMCNNFYVNLDDSMRLYHSRIISLESLVYIDCNDTNTKINIYKILGMSNNDNLLECAILLDFELSLEILQILIRAKITFVIAKQIQNFGVLKTAQKFGLTIGYFSKNEVNILSHSSRIV